MVVSKTNVEGLHPPDMMDENSLKPNNKDKIHILFITNDRNLSKNNILKSIPHRLKMTTDKNNEIKLNTELNPLCKKSDSSE